MTLLLLLFACVQHDLYADLSEDLGPCDSGEDTASSDTGAD